jgi:hypothetical protein
MPPDTERFIELASQPLARNAELHLAATAELRRRLEVSQPTPEAVDDAVRTFERADRHPMFRHWKAVFYAVTLVVALGVIAFNVRQASGLAQLWSSISSFGFDYDNQPKWKTENLTEKDRLLLFGDEASPSNPGRWKPLWDSEPRNPAFLAQYAARYFQEYKDFSPEIIAAADDIDPDNGWFKAMTASGISEGAVTRQKQGSANSKDIITPIWQIDDPDRLNSALEMIHQAMAKPGFRNYEKELIAQRIPLLPKRTDFASQMVPVAYMAGMTSSIISMRKLADVLCAGAQEAAARGDAESFKRIVSDWEKLSMHLTRNGFTLIDLLVAKVFLFAPAENFRDAAAALGLETERKRFEELHELKKADKAWKNVRGRTDPSEDMVRQRGSILTALTLPMLGRQVKTPPMLAEDELRPGRYADHALFSRGLALLALLVLGISAGLAALQRFRLPMLYRLLSARILDQIRWSDWLWVFCGGILLPFFHYFTWIYLTPFSSREWSLGYMAFFHPGFEFVALIVMMWTLSSMMVSWRLSKRGRLIGLESRHAWFGWIAVASTALAIPVAGLLVSSSRTDDWMLYAAASFLIPPLLWILVGCARNLFGNSTHALRRGILARMLVPTWVSGMLLMVLSVPVCYSIERHWIPQDRQFEVRAEAPAMVKYEWDVTQVLREELLEIQR